VNNQLFSPSPAALAAAQGQHDPPRQKDFYPSTYLFVFNGYLISSREHRDGQFTDI